MTVTVEYATEHLPDLLAAADRGECIAISQGSGHMFDLVPRQQSTAAELGEGDDYVQIGRFRPVKITGEPLSETIIRDRRGEL